jgi:cell division protein FtsX
MIVGFAGAIVAFFIVESCYIAAVSALGSIPAGTIISLKNFGEIWHMILLPFILVGVSIGAIGSAMSIRKYLRV